MLETGSYLNLDWFAVKNSYRVHGTITVTWPNTSVIHNQANKLLLQTRNGVILSHCIRYDKTAAGNVLHLRKAYAFALQFLDNRFGGFRGSAGGFEAERVADSSNGRLVALRIGTPKAV